MYALKNSQEHENSPHFVTDIIQVFNFAFYALVDPGASLSFVIPYVALNFDIKLEQLSEQFSVSTRIRESIPAERIYRDCPVSINHKNTTIDLVELDMVEFNVILV